MKLVLTSTGLSNQKIIDRFLGIFDKNPKESNLLVVAYGQTEKENFYINEAKKEVEALGFNTTVLNMNNESDLSELKDFDAIYVCGGNTYSILNKMKETEVYGFIKSQVKKGAVYIGVSAGSIIAGSDIEIAGWGVDGDTNDVGLEDISGFNFTDISIFPHFEESQHADEVEEFKKKVDYPVQELTDEQALIISESQKILI